MPPFADALLNAEMPVIMEVKRRNAYGEDLFRGRSVREIVNAYEQVEPPCLSVVTGSWFGGDDQLLREVVALANRPVLEKDFIRGRRQIVDAKRMGAAAVLLTAALLPGSLLERLIDDCLRAELTPFVEIVSVEQLQRAADVGACVVAINNKDIRRGERGQADIHRSPRLLPAVRRAGAACAISAGGIASPAVGAQLLAAGFDALLVGDALLRADALEPWTRALRRTRRGAHVASRSQTGYAGQK
jgi:indole-3-glycerol phosphate synthase